MDLETLRHSCSHILAQAVKEIWPQIKLGIGPAIEEGFYYDFDKKEPFSPEDLAKIEQRMKQIIKEDEPFIREELNKKEAERLFKELKEDYKLELIREIPEEKVTIYKTDNKFTDLCRGPHLESTGKIRVFKLLSVAGAYWRGKESNPMLQRIYGAAFETQKELDEFLRIREEAKQRDHRRLGRELELFSIQDEMGAGLVLWHTKGAIMRRIIEDFWVKQHLLRGYQLVNIPHIAKVELWKRSGHWEFYRDYIYSPMAVENEDYIIKPMNCPGHILIYKSKTRSYRDLPLRWAELGTVYRYERSGVLHGLLRVRGFTQDDAHIFCRPQELEGEIVEALKLTLFILRSFGFKDYEVFLSTQPEKYVGTQDSWQKATTALKSALEHPEVNLRYTLDPGQGVFYGPKIDVKIKDVLGRAWQCSTIQVDFNLPERFNVNFIDQDGEKKQAIMIHRAILGSLERFFGVLIEHYGGAFPLWLSPEQMIVLPIKSENQAYGLEVTERLKAKGLRARIDSRSETLNRRIREAELKKIPYLLVIGDKEAESKTVSVRQRGFGDRGRMGLDEFIKRASQEAEERACNLSAY